MAIICLDGPSAVGKTSNSQRVAERMKGVAIQEAKGARYIPEHLTGWDRTQWLLDAQAERWSEAVEVERSGRLAVLDNDHFKLYYDWVYGFVEGTEAGLLDFYRNRLLEQQIGYPDRYYILDADEAVLRSRKESDTTRSRRGFEKHIAIIEPIQRYFKAMEVEAPGLVTFLRSDEVESTSYQIIEQIPHASSPHRSSVALFDAMWAWMETHPA